MVERVVIYVAAFTLGAALMAFEMLVARMLTPYFGSGIYTWASVISVVLFAMMIGYFLGGYLVDRYPTLRIAAIFASVAGVWFLTLPFFSEALLEAVIDSVRDEVTGAMIGSAALQLVPIIALGAYSPIAIRVRLSDISVAGSTAGVIYAVSTIGNVVGVLGAALYLIANVGLQASVFMCGFVCVAMAALLWVAARR